MYTFVITYTDNSEIVCEHITSAVYFSAGNYEKVPETDLVTHCFSVSKPLWLYGDGKSLAICHDNVRSIEVTKESGE